MENKKVTKKENFEVIKNILIELGNEGLADVMQHEIDLIDKKSANRKSYNTKNQAENEKIMNIIIAELTRLGEMVTISELQAQSEELSTTKYTNQKMSALMTKLVNNNQVIKTINKKKSYFSIA